MFTSIIVAVDGSDHAHEALNAAVAIAGLTGGNLHVVTVPQPVIDPVIVGYTTVPIPISQDDLDKSAKATLDTALGRIPEGVKARTSAKTLFGDPAHAIVDEAAAVKADLIVLGRRGLGRLAGLLVGSTTTKVAQLAPCAVLTVK
jgi:nucleotide-binding universal stress UspA family protein